MPIPISKFDNDTALENWLANTSSLHPAIVESREGACDSLSSQYDSERILAAESFIYCWWSDRQSLRLLALVAEADSSVAVRYSATSALLVLHMRSYGTDYRDYIQQLLRSVIEANHHTSDLADDVRRHLACWGIE